MSSWTTPSPAAPLRRTDAVRRPRDRIRPDTLAARRSSLQLPGLQGWRQRGPPPWTSASAGRHREPGVGIRLKPGEPHDRLQGATNLHRTRGESRRSREKRQGRNGTRELAAPGRRRWSDPEPGVDAQRGRRWRGVFESTMNGVQHGSPQIPARDRRRRHRVLAPRAAARDARSSWTTCRDRHRSRTRTRGVEALERKNQDPDHWSSPRRSAPWRQGAKVKAGRGKGQRPATRGRRSLKSLLIDGQAPQRRDHAACSAGPLIGRHAVPTRSMVSHDPPLRCQTTTDRKSVV